MGNESAEQFIGQSEQIHWHYSALRGASDARNYGASIVTAPFIMFLDSDNIIAASSAITLDKLVQAISQNPDLIILQRAEAGRKIAPAHPTKYNFSLHCIEWNCIWRREHFWALGGFDERFGPGSPTLAQTGEAFSLCFKHFNTPNNKTIYLPDIKVRHPSLDNSKKSAQRQFEYAYGSHYAAFEPFMRAPSRLATFWFLRTLIGVSKDMLRDHISLHARLQALYDVFWRKAPRSRQRLPVLSKNEL
ncbi:MAG: glycosyltransferase family 2 protein [Anaerolineae bacterium]|nr:glycosyltransferase family 2 protein [Anaerolineae bacterium]